MARPDSLDRSSFTFTGTWRSSFGALAITQVGSRATGSYVHKGGTLEGEVEGGVLRGRWAEASGKGGPVELTLDDHGSAFHGAWKEEGADAWMGGWDGLRLGLSAEGEGSPGGWNSHQDGPILSGPMVGETTPTDAWIWAQARSTDPLTLTVYRSGGRQIRVVEEPVWEEWLCVVFHVRGLAPGESCEYAIEGAYGTTRRHELTAAPPDEARRVRIPFGSCFWDFPNGRLGIFDAIRREAGHVFLMIGDNAYFAEPDWQTEHTMMLAHLRHRNNEPLRRLLAETSVLGVWDDHDFGPNDVDGNFRGKSQSLRAFQRCWAQSGYGISEVPGVFSSVRKGPVEIFLLDSRYYRGIEGRNILGAAQLGWLLDGLRTSSAPVKLVASPSQVLPEHPVRHGWDCFRREAPDELEAILGAIESEDIQGVVFISGDLHMANLMYMEGRSVGDGTGPDFWELTSSPLANKPWNVAAGEDPYLQEEIIDRSNYGVVDVDLDREDAEITLSLKDERGAVLFERQIALSSLAVR